MKNIFLLIVLFFSFNFSFSANKEVEVTCSESDATIFANGSVVGTGHAIVLVKAYSSTFVRIEKKGFFTQEITYYNDNDHAKTPKTDYITLIKNDAYDASASNDIANNNIDLTTKYPEDKAWKLIVEIISNTIDNLEEDDKSSGYLKTAWVTQSFKESTIRTRVIVKPSSGETLKYKVKVESEIADSPNVSVKEDEKFKPWDRVLKKYSELVIELTSRLK